MPVARWIHSEIEQLHPVERGNWATQRELLLDEYGLGDRGQIASDRDEMWRYMNAAADRSGQAEANASGSAHLAASPVPAGWFADPMERNQLRYWDGREWTPHVSNDGVISHDPIEG